jgi:hypothetical protein
MADTVQDPRDRTVAGLLDAAARLHVQAHGAPADFSLQQTGPFLAAAEKALGRYMWPEVDPDAAADFVRAARRRPPIDTGRLR